MKLQKLTTAILLGIATLLLVLGCETDSSSDDNPSPTTAITGTFRYEKLDINAQKDHSIQENAVKWDDDDNDAAANQTDNLLYRIAPGLPAGLEINEDTGEITGTPTKDSSSKLYTVTAKGKDKFSGSIDTTLYITVVDDTKTLIKGTFAYPNIDVIGATSVDMTANSQDPIPTWSEGAEASSITYTITPALPEGLSFATDTGAITGTSKNPVPKTRYKIIATGSGSYGGSYTTSISITITEKFPITETGATLSYDAILLKINVGIDTEKEGAAIWDKKPQGMEVTFSSDPELPEGLILNRATGAITGKSSVVSKQEYTITATVTSDVYQGSIESKVSIEVTEPPRITGNFTYNNKADVQIIKGPATKTFDPTWENQAQDQLDNLQYSIAPSTPNVLTIDTSTGEISVIPTQVMEKKLYTVTATGIGDFEGSLTSVINIEIINPPITGTFTYKEITFAKETTAGSVEEFPNWIGQAANQLNSLHYSVAPPLPDGLGINKDTGEISGTPRQTTEKKPYKVTAIGKNNFSGEKTFDIYITITAQIDGILSYQDSVLLQDAINLSPNWTDVTDTDQKLHYSVDSNTPLPAGVVINSESGIITGMSATEFDSTYIINVNGILPYIGTIKSSAKIKTQETTFIYTHLDEQFLKDSAPTKSTPSFISGISATDGTFSIAPSGIGDTGRNLPTIIAETGVITVDKFTTIGSYKVIFTPISGDSPIESVFYKTKTPTSTSTLVSTLILGTYQFGYEADFNFIITDAITSMKEVFSHRSLAPNFNGDISKWNVSNVTDMTSMFKNAINFNGDLSKWDVGKVKNMFSMFENAVKFNRDISKWNIRAQHMSRMFKGAAKFNQNIGNWNMNVSYQLNSMFEDAVEFNGDISNWNVMNASNLESMFKNAVSFNRDLRTWNLASAHSLLEMFEGAIEFNSDISGWKLTHASSFVNMFKNAAKFDHELEDWKQYFILDEDTGKAKYNKHYYEMGAKERVVFYGGGMFDGTKLAADGKTPSWYE